MNYQEFQAKLDEIDSQLDRLERDNTRRLSLLAIRDQIIKEWNTPAETYAPDFE